MPTLAPVESADFWAVARLYFNVKRWVEITLTAGKDSRLISVVGSELENIDMDVATSLRLMLSVVEVARFSGVVV